ncbi:protein-glutamate methylesterase/protein-glutamine glutaminase [Roseospirillum parvum]|nr:chemotaxis response regulator protein-glutamate methylesterase [Roseospirillum parvum]
MVVDDSAVVRGLESRILQADPGITVVASVGNGQVAVQALERHDVEVIVLDIEMPVMDGLTALPELLKRDPNLKIIMSSTLTLKNAEVSLTALSKGAADYIPKPTASRDMGGGQDFAVELVSKVKTLGRVRRQRSGLAKPLFPPRSRTPVGTPATPAAPAVSALSLKGPLQLRPPPTERPDLIAIGSSTGGPQALFKVLGDITAAGGVPQPIMITQHMPATFTTILAEHITRSARMSAKEGVDGELIKGGQVYVAPGGFHMVAKAEGTQRKLALNQDPPENFCRPSVDPMLRSLAQIYGRRLLVVILTGMGSDGAKGGKVVVDSGGSVVAQDEATSVVWGMPGAAAQAGICSAVLPLSEIGSYVHRLATKR